MKLITGLLVLLLGAWTTASFAQTPTYYWSGNEQIPLIENRSSVAIHFEKGSQLHPEIVHDQIEKVEYHSNHNRLILHLTNDLAATAEEFVQQLGLFPAEIRSSEFGFETADGVPVWLTHDVVLQFAAGYSLSDLSRLLSTHQASFSRLRYETIVLEVNSPSEGLSLANTLRESGMVKWCLPDFYAPPNLDIDPNYGQQFQMNNTGQTIDGTSSLFDVDCNAPEAWSVTTGSSSVIVAVIDDGVEDHQDLETTSGATRVLNGFTPATSGNGSPGSGGAHGQACSGIIAASHNEIGVRGVAPLVQLLPINIFTGGETTQDIADGFSYARDNGADVISNSWGYSTSCGTSFANLTSAINSAATSGRGGLGCVIAFSTGNDYQTCVNYPAFLNSVTAVGAVTNQGNHSIYSNQGSAIDVVAPSDPAPGQSGAGVRTIDREGSSGYSSGNYISFFGGTSAACPVVAGVMALAVSVDPLASAADIRTLINTTATDMGSAGFDNTYGHGRINASGVVSGPVTPTISFSGNVVDAVTSAPISGVEIKYEGAGGEFLTTTDAAGNYSVSGLVEGEVYLIFLGKWGYLSKTDASVVLDGSSYTSFLDAGYSDEFNVDLGWTVTGDATTGQWVRENPIATANSGTAANPGIDAADFGQIAYITGNGGGSAGTDDVDNGFTRLTSPAFDLTGYTNPYLRYSRWFFNQGGTGVPDDELVITLSNGITSVILETADQGSAGNSSWQRRTFRVSDFLTPTANMQIWAETSDLAGSGHLVEAGFDRFLTFDSTFTPPPSDCTIPPDGLTATLDPTGVFLGWNSSASNGAISYLVEGRKAGSSGAFKSLPLVSEPTTGTFVSETKLRNISYEWKVTAYCGASVGYGPPSALNTFTWSSLRTGVSGNSTQLAPNPANQNTLLSINSKLEGKAAIQIIDLSGKTVSKYTHALNAGNNSIVLDLSALSEGMYQVAITHSGATSYTDLLVVR